MSILTQAMTTRRIGGEAIKRRSSHPGPTLAQLSSSKAESAAHAAGLTSGSKYDAFHKAYFDSYMIHKDESKAKQAGADAVSACQANGTC